MTAHWQTYVMCLFCRHLDYFAAILEAKKDIAYFILWATGRSGPENML